MTVIYVASAPAIPEIRPSSTPPESTVAKSEVNPIPLESAAPVEINHIGAREVDKPGAFRGPSLPAQSDPFDRAEKAALVRLTLPQTKSPGNLKRFWSAVIPFCFFSLRRLFV